MSAPKITSYLIEIMTPSPLTRFASIVAKRLESLGALTHGDRRATESRDLSKFNIDNKYGRAALEATFKAIMGYEQPIVKPPEDYQGDFFKGNLTAPYLYLPECYIWRVQGALTAPHCNLGQYYLPILRGCCYLATAMQTRLWLLPSIHYIQN